MIQRILIAEDETLTRESIYSGLSKLLPDAVFFLAGNGREAVSLAETHDVQLAFLDIRMPEMDGIAAAQCIAKLRPNCQLIFLTAYSDFAYMSQAVELGALSYILKPFSHTALAVALQKANARLERLDSDLKERERSQGEINKLTHLVEEQVLSQIISGYQGKEQIAETLLQKDILFARGMFAVIGCDNERQLKRLHGIIRGENWGADLRLLNLAAPDCLILLAIGGTAEALARFQNQLSKLFVRLRGPLHVKAACGIGRVFSDLQDGQTACFDAFCQMRLCSDAEPFRSATSPNLPDVTLPLIPFTAKLFSQLQQDNAADFLLQAIWAYLHLLRFNFRTLRDELARLCELLCGDDAAAARTYILHTDSEESLLSACHSLIVRREAAQGNENAADDNGVRLKIQTYLEAHCQEDISLEQAAEAMQYSAAHFSRLFSRLFGQSFTTALTALRIERAKVLLRDTEHSIKDVSRLSGFSDASYFTNVFRKQTGMRPSEYRSSAAQHAETSQVRPQESATRSQRPASENDEVQP